MESVGCLFWLLAGLSILVGLLVWAERRRQVKWDRLREERDRDLGK
jgi:hypothetical protein